MTKPEDRHGQAVDLRTNAPGPSVPGEKKSTDRKRDLSLPLPHEREQAEIHYDESEPSPQMEQAYRDLDRGLVDTDLRSEAARNFDEADEKSPATRRSGAKPPKP